MDRRLVAIVVPVSLHPTLSADEEISLRHLHHFLGKYDKFLVTAKSTRFKLRGFDVMAFPDKYFGSAQAHAQLQVAKEFYARFRDYKYILMYHLDALALSDRLLEWCESDLDYIGAPWLHSSDSPWVKRPRVGNSGFALIKIESFLKVMKSRLLAEDPDECWKRVCASIPTYQRWLHLPRKYLTHLHVFNGVKQEVRDWPSRPGGEGNTDLFWADRAVRYWPEFKVASVETGLKFAFEAAPRMCFELNNRQLPFGCHAWPRYDRAFWERHLLR